MHHLKKDHETFVRFSWFWTPAAMLATAMLVIVATLAIPVMFIVAQLALPRTVKPLPDS